MSEPKRVYICTPLKEGKFNLPAIVDILNSADVFAYIPPNDKTKPKDSGAILNKRMIDMCDEVWAFSEFGNDCSWELGYAAGLGKPVRLYMQPNSKNHMDWMLWTTNNIFKVELHEII